jgi:hypothetical protein
VARLDWQKAQERDRKREAKQAAAQMPGRAGARRQAARQAALTAFVQKHDIACFKCGAKTAEWAKTGIHPKRGPWAICVPCVSRRD